MSTVPGSSINQSNATKGKGREYPRSYLCYWNGGSRRAQEGENRSRREKKKVFEGDEQCGVAERMNVTVG